MTGAGSFLQSSECGAAPPSLLPQTAAFFNLKAEADKEKPELTKSQKWWAKSEYQSGPDRIVKSRGEHALNCGGNLERIYRTGEIQRAIAGQRTLPVKRLHHFLHE
jgi:hypothetical protein